VVCRNRRATFDFAIEERIEAGLVLVGSEVKSLRDGRAQLTDAYAVIEGGEVWLLNAHISEWPHAKYFGHEPTRRRKLLMKAREIARLKIALERRGYTLVALSLYFNERQRVKVELGLARGKRMVDKREVIRARDDEREARRGDAV